MSAPRWQEQLKAALGVLPHPLGLITSDGLRLMVRSSARESRRSTRTILAKLEHPDSVLSGPFEGMRFRPIAMSSQGGVLPKLLGCYESECAPAIARLIDSNADVVVNIGAAEGYYAVGLARRMSRAQIIAFELETAFHGAIRALASANGVSARVTLRGMCTADSLSTALRGASDPAVVCDCEGFEDTLLDPSVVPELRHSRILVEVHEEFAQGVGARLCDRFCGTHSLVVYHPTDGAAELPLITARLSASELAFATSEGRASQPEWFWFEPIT